MRVVAGGGAAALTPSGPGAGQYEELYLQLCRQQRDAYKELTWRPLLVRLGRGALAPPFSHLTA